MENASRQAILKGVETVVVKVGSRVLSGSDGCLDIAQVRSLATQLAGLADGGHQVVLVSSGAVASGMGRLGLTQRPSDLARLQAVAAVGQAHLIQAYESYFSTLGHHAAQILLIADDLDDRTRYLNVRNTLLALLQLRVIPIINENDTVAVDELLTTFGDNDRLAAMVAGLFSRPALIILSDVEGVYNMDPRHPQAEVLHTIQQVDQSIFDLAINRSTGISKGGMASKLKAAQFVTQSGAPVVIAGGRIENVLPRLVAGEELGTIFLPNQRGMAPKKRWIGFTAQANGMLTVDAGAARALRSGGPSLLAIGIVRVSGHFVKGEVLSVMDETGIEIARGLTNYSSQELIKICGLRSLAIAEVLGYCPYEEVIHRDNMTIIG